MEESGVFDLPALFNLVHHAVRWDGQIPAQGKPLTP